MKGKQGSSSSTRGFHCINKNHRLLIFWCLYMVALSVDADIFTLDTSFDLLPSFFTTIPNHFILQFPYSSYEGSGVCYTFPGLSKDYCLKLWNDDVLCAARVKGRAAPSWSSL